MITRRNLFAGALAASLTGVARDARAEAVDVDAEARRTLDRLLDIRFKYLGRPNPLLKLVIERMLAKGIIEDYTKRTGMGKRAAIEKLHLLARKRFGGGFENAITENVGIRELDYEFLFGSA